MAKMSVRAKSQVIESENKPRGLLINESRLCASVLSI